MMRLPNFVVQAYQEVPKLAKPGPKEFAIAIWHLVFSKYNYNEHGLIKELSAQSKQ